MSSKRGKGKRSKGTPISDSTGLDSVLPGRRECLCEANLHELIANCLNCGRIVCAQEGSGHCFTCGKLVLSRSERQLLMSNTDDGKELLKYFNSLGVSDDTLVESGVQLQKSCFIGPNLKDMGLKDIAKSFDLNNSKGLVKAIAHKDKMLEYDENSSVRTKVIDDENDYFSLPSQNWISREKRNALKQTVEELHENKLKKNKKILIDLVGKSALDYDEPVIDNFDERVAQLHSESALKSDYQTVDASQFINRENQNLPILIYIDDKSGHKIRNKYIDNSCNNRIQDKQLLELSDEGMCLSVNQPFASLLISGIKHFEGRNWYSAFRGRLWIHASNKKPSEEKVKEVEKFYGYAGIHEFPSYPISSLLGTVNVVDCLPFEEFKLRYPEGDTEDSYIYICEQPKRLVKPFPVSSGGKQIYKLEQTLHKNAKKLLIL